MTIRLRHLAAINPPVPGWELIPDDCHLAFVPLEAVWPRQVDFTRLRPKSEVSTGYTRFMEGDVIVPKITPTFEADRSTWVQGSPTTVLTGTTELHVVRPSANLDPRYLDYLFSSRPFLEGGANEMIGVAGQKRVPEEWLCDYRLPITDLQQQWRIAEYLDSETAHIDTLISKKHRLIELLHDRRKISGEGVIAEFRQSEKLVPLKYLVRESDIRQGLRAEPTKLSVSIHHGVTPLESVSNDGSRAGDFSNYKVCQPGDIVINRMRAFQGAVGIANQGGIVSPDYTVLRVGSRVSANYLHFVMRSSWFISEMTRRLRGIGSTDQGQVRTPRINFADLGLIKIPVPPREHQDEFALNLTHQEERLTHVVDLLTQQLDSLGERRQALITSVVTGEMAVPRTGT